MSSRKWSVEPVKATPVDNDETLIIDSVGGLNKKITLGSLPGIVWQKISGVISPKVATDKLEIGGNFTQNSTAAPVLSGSLADSTNFDGPSDIQVVGNYAYIAGLISDTFTIVDVTDPLNPFRVATYTSNANLEDVRGLFISGNFAYTGTPITNKLTLIDISNPSTIVTPVVHVLTDGDFNGFEAIYVAGGYAYIVTKNGSNKFLVVDVTDPTLASDDPPPTILARITNANFSALEDIFVQGKYAYIVSSGNDRFITYDISDTTAPVVKGDITAGGTQFDGINSVHVEGRYAYVTAFNDDTMSIIDVKNPEVPVLVGTTASSVFINDPTDVRVAGKFAYVSSQQENFAVVDVSDPTNPTVVGGLTGVASIAGALSLDVSGKFAYVAGFNTDTLQIIELTGIDAPTANIGNLKTSNLNVIGSANIQNKLTAGSANIGQGGMMVTGDLVVQGGQNSRLVLGPMNDISEGGEILWRGAGGADNWQQDLAGSTMRLFTTSSTDEAVLLFNAGSANMNLRIDGSLHVGSNSAPLSTLEIDGTMGVHSKTSATDITSDGTSVILALTDTSAPRTATLQTADKILDRIYIISDEGGQAGVNNITVQTQGSELIDGVATVKIVANFGALRVYFDGVNWKTW